MKNLLIGLTIALAVYAFVFRPAHTRRVADKAAAGAAGGARKGINGYLGRADQIWQLVAFFAGLIVFWMFFRDDDTPAPANDTAEATETGEAAATTEGVSGPLNVGDEGADVIAVQERLAAEGLPVTVDGVYGQETADAVMAFQEQEQLTVDGVVGSETGEALGIWSS
jgi:Putative peptidoglycan binding domain